MMSIKRWIRDSRRLIEFWILSARGRPMYVEILAVRIIENGKEESHRRGEIRFHSGQ
jgi:hypothetical protein